MFLSVIVSCHNCRPYIKRLMNSLLVQDFDDMEVIISDDNSTDNFMEIVDNYKPFLDIKYFKVNEHKVHCPGNTRMDGLSHASGTWVTFMDHDDEFVPGAFKQVQRELIANSQYNIPFVFSPVQRVDVNGNNIDLLEAVTWLHGNFYKKSFLQEFNINFKEDLFGNEDLFFNNQVNGICSGMSLPMLKLPNGIYKWYSNPKSLSNDPGTKLTYTEEYFADYLTANSEPHIRCYNMFPDKHEQFKLELLQALIYSYFYYQRALYEYQDETILENMLEAIRNKYKEICQVLQMSTEDFLKFMHDNPDRYQDSKSTIYKLSGKFVESKSFNDFFNNL